MFTRYEWVCNVKMRDLRHVDEYDVNIKLCSKRDLKMMFIIC